MSESNVILSVSGGKDSTAMYLLAMRMEVDFTAVFADTGHEHEITYEYVKNLPKRTGGPEIKRVQADFSGKFPEHRKSIQAKWREEGIAEDIIERAMEVLQPTGNPFLDVCLLYSRFPGFKRQFCTGLLKVKPIRAQIYEPILDAGGTIQSWHGIRADESRRRACHKRMSRESWDFGKYSISILRPLLDWTIADVLKEHRRHGLKPNPLYAEGMMRVGCAPCIYAWHSEIKLWAKKFPQTIDKIREWESIVNQVRTGDHGATFFDPPPRRVSVPVHFQTHGVDAKVEYVLRDDGQEAIPGIGAACALLRYCE